MVHDDHDLVFVVDVVLVVEAVLQWVVGDHFVAEAPTPHLEEGVQQPQRSHQ